MTGQAAWITRAAVLCQRCSMCGTLRELLNLRGQDESLLIPEEPDAIALEELRKATGLGMPRIGTAIAVGITEGILGRSGKNGAVYRRKDPA